MGQMEQVLISVIMPSYNAEKFIVRTIESVLSQGYINWELLVIDDCSNDNTRNLVNNIAQTDSRIRLVVLDKNNGAPAAPRNIGVQEAKGRWIAFLDADDIWHPDKLEIQMNEIHKEGAVFCSSAMLDFTDDRLLSFSKPGDIQVKNISFCTQLRKFRTPTSSVIASRELLLKFPFNEDISYKAREDFECWLRIHEKIGNSIKLLYPLLYYRIVDGQISGAKWKMTLKTYMVLSKYRLISGKGLGWKVFYYVVTQSVYSIYFRIFKKSL
ncbi:MAG: glycosyltransferase family 2 protein [Proteobacteria bacterium]|nr:glycosyltransferase family 2 protein [Pseudomonadota bacterium]